MSLFAAEMKRVREAQELTLRPKIRWSRFSSWVLRSDMLDFISLIPFSSLSHWAIRQDILACLCSALFSSLSIRVSMEERRLLVLWMF